MSDFPTIYRRNLPHYQPYGAILFFTYRLAGSLPWHVLDSLKEEREREERRLRLSGIESTKRKPLCNMIRRNIFLKFDNELDTGNTGPTWLAQADIAELICEAIFHRHPQEYELICFCTMANHVHQVVLNIHDDAPINHPIGRLKSYTASEANKILQGKGQFWQHESSDHVVRTGKLGATIQYVLTNPVEAGLVRHWELWPHSWLNPRYDKPS